MNVPKLRFKEFTDVWKMIKLDELYEFKNGINADRTAYGKGVPLISVTDIINNNFITYNKIRGRIDISNNMLMNNSVEYGDILFQRSSETFAEIGTSNIYLDNKIATFGGFVIRGKRKNNEIPLFINYELKSPNSRKKIIIKGAGAQHYNIGQEDLRQVNIFVPSKEEQTKISNFLSLLDKKIELQTRKIEDLKLYKKGLIKNFFNESNLKTITINDLGTIVTGTTPSKLNDDYWKNGKIVWITPTDIGENRDINDSLFKITEEGLKHGKFIPKNSILVTCIASIGKNAILKSDGSCNQQINAIIPNKNYNYNYVYYLVNSISNYMQYIAGTSATSIINKESFSKISVKVHNLEQQNFIDKVLSSFENKIIKENIKLEQLNLLKKGLMQNMFV